jgi:hypothetical protein
MPVACWVSQDKLALGTVAVPTRAGTQRRDNSYHFATEYLA